MAVFQGGTPAQLSLYIYSIATITIFLWGLKKIAEVPFRFSSFPLPLLLYSLTSLPDPPGKRSLNPTLRAPLRDRPLDQHNLHDPLRRHVVRVRAARRKASRQFGRAEGDDGYCGRRGGRGGKEGCCGGDLEGGERVFCCCARWGVDTQGVCAEDLVSLIFGEMTRWGTARANSPSRARPPRSTSSSASTRSRSTSAKGRTTPSHTLVPSPPPVDPSSPPASQRAEHNTRNCVARPSRAISSVRGRGPESGSGSGSGRRCGRRRSIRMKGPCRARWERGRGGIRRGRGEHCLGVRVRRLIWGSWEERGVRGPRGLYPLGRRWFREEKGMEKREGWIDFLFLNFIPGRRSLPTLFFSSFRFF